MAFNPKDYDPIDVADSANMQASSDGRVFNANDYDFENMPPDWANGMSPTAPLAESAISAEERFNLALGNKRGNVDYLKKKFGEQNVVLGEDGDELVVRGGDGLWRAVDPDTLGEADAWTATKGIVRGWLSTGAAAAEAMMGGVGRRMAQDIVAGKSVGEAARGIVSGTIGTAKKLAGTNPVAQEFVAEAAENAPGAATAGVIAGTGGLGTGIVAPLAIAGTTAVGLEGARTSLGRLEGTYKATVEEQLRDVAVEGLINMGGTAISLGTKPTAAFLSKTKAWQKTAELLNAADDSVKGAIKRVYGGISGLGDDGIDALMKHGKEIQHHIDDVAIRGLDKAQVSQVEDLKGVITGLQQAKSSVYRSMREEVLKNVDKGFSGNIAQIIDDPLMELTQLGFFGRVGNDVIVRSPKAIAQELLKRGLIKESTLALDQEVYKAIREFSEVAIQLRKAKALRGRAGAEQLMDAASAIKDLTFKYKHRGDNEGVRQLSTYFAKFANDVDSAMTRVLDKGSPAGPWSKMNETYSKFSDLLEESSTKMRRGDAGLETYINQLSSRAGRNAAKKEGFDAAIELAERSGAPQVQQVLKLRDSLSNRAMALQLSNIAGGKPWMQSAAAGMAMTAAVSGNPLMAAAIVGGAAIRSPRFNSRMILAGQDFNRMVTKLNPIERLRLLGSPQIFLPTLNAVFSSDNTAEQTKQQLLMGNGLGQQQ